MPTRRPFLRHLTRAALGLSAAGALCLASPLAVAQTAPTLRLITHSSFDLPKPLLQRFEQEAGVKLAVIKAGDAGEMLNKLILTRRQPIADVVFGLDNTLVVRALQAQVIEPYQGPAAQRPALAELVPGVVAVDQGHVTLNVDRAWFTQRGLPWPTRLEDLTTPAYRGLTVVQNPATSSTGMAFMLATIAGLGEEAAFDWWARLRANGLKVAKGWSEAYYTDFSRNGGSRPIVVSYASSPAAEVFYSKTPLTEPPTASLSLPGAVFRQVEGVALVRGGQQRAAAERWIEFMRSPAVQEALQTTMWMGPVEPGVSRAEVMRHAPEPTRFDNPQPQQIAQRSAEWLRRWTQTVLK